MDDNTNVNAAILERLEKVVQSLQENSVKMGELLAVHNEKLDKQDRIDAVLFEKIEQVDQKLDRHATDIKNCLLYTSPSPRDLTTSRMPSSA